MVSPSPRQRFVQCNSREPRGELRALLELIEMRERIDVRLLHHVFRVGLVLDDGARHSIDALVMTPHQDFEKGGVAFTDPRNDLGIRRAGCYQQSFHASLESLASRSVASSPFVTFGGPSTPFRHGGVLMNTDRLTAAWWALRVGLGAAAFLAGLDKFFNILADWPAYLSPLAAQILPMSASSFMHIVGIVEMVVGAVILAGYTQLGGYVAAIWLLAIAVNLVTSGHYFDVAVRDVAMSIAAFTLARLTEAGVGAEARTRVSTQLSTAVAVLLCIGGTAAVLSAAAQQAQTAEADRR